MKQFAKWMLVHALALVISCTAAIAQERPAFSQAQLDQMLAPVALYPDALLSQILMASTYPLEVVQAARWSRANPGYRGEDAVRAVESMDWDPSIKSLVAFPQVLARLDERLEWTQSLGEAFLAQQEQVMDTVQNLRRKAAAAGNLYPDDHFRVTRDDAYIAIEPAYPGMIYVPYYNPVVVYGPWWWPAYPPVYWEPPAGYYAVPTHGWYWGSGISISVGFFFGAFDWHHRHVRVVHAPYYHAHAVRTVSSGPVVWKHDVGHRRGVPYRHAATHREFTRERSTAVDGRRGFRQRNATPAARLAGETGNQAAGRRPSVRDSAPVRTLVPGNNNRTVSAAGHERDERAGATGNNAGSRRVQTDRQSSRIDKPRPDSGPRAFRNPAPGPAARTPVLRTSGVTEPRVRSVRERVTRATAPAPLRTQHANPAPRPAARSTAPRADRARESGGNGGTRAGGGNPFRQQFERARDRRP
jgi:hypothetical protein